MKDKEFLRIFHLYKNDIYRLAYSYTKNYFDADDIVQNSFVKLYNNLEKFNNDDEIKKWLVKVSINDCKTLFLSAWKRKIFPITDMEENNLKIMDDTNNNELLESLFKLNKKYRVILYLYYYDGYKIKEISNILNLNESTVKTRLSRAKSQLKDIILGGNENE